MKTRLGCEQLGDRITPAYVTFSGGGDGSFTYNDSEIDPNQSSQAIHLSEFQFSATGMYYTSSDATAYYSYGQFASLHADAVPNPGQQGPPPPIGIDVDSDLILTAVDQDNGMVVAQTPVTFNTVKSTIILDPANPPVQYVLNGVPQAGVMKVSVQWYGGVPGANNSIQIEMYKVGVAQPIDTQGDNNKGSSGFLYKTLSGTTGQQVYFKLILKDKAGTVLATKTTGNYTLP